MVKGSVGTGSPGTRVSYFCWHASLSCGAYHTSRQGIRHLGDGSLTDSSRYPSRESGITKFMTPVLRDMWLVLSFHERRLAFFSLVLLSLYLQGMVACEDARAAHVPSERSWRRVQVAYGS